MLRLLLPTLLAASACSPRLGPDPVPFPGDAPPYAEHLAQAQTLAQRYPIVDGHIDLPNRIASEEVIRVGELDPNGDFDFQRARAGGLDAPFMSIYIPAGRQDVEGSAYRLADSLITLVEGVVAESPDEFFVGASPDDVERAHREGRVALLMGMENGAPISSLADLRHFYARGIRYVSLTHGRDNQLGDASYDTSRTHGGISPLGADVVREMNRLGILVDLSHLSDQTAFDALEITAAPVIASHSSAQHFTPGWERNMSDALLDALRVNDGVVMINFGSSFLRQAYQAEGTRFRQRMQRAMRDAGVTDPTSPEGLAVYYRMRRDFPVGDVSDVADHIDYVRDRIGTRHIGLGSDFDGVTNLPRGLTDASMYPNLIAELIRRGYEEDEIAGILGGNVLRVWREAERVAAQMQAANG
jgi:membrane dipeptidase